MSECPVANCRAGNRRKPAVKYGVLGRQRRKNRDLVWSEVVHDGMRSLRTGALGRVAFDESLHVRHTPWSKGRSTKNLQVDPGEMMVWIVCQLAAINGVGRDGDGLTIIVRI